MTPGKVQRTGSATSANTNASAAGPTPGKAPLTAGMSAPALAGPTAENRGEVDATMAAVPASERSSTLLSWIGQRLTIAGQRWFGAIERGHTKAMLAHKESAPVWLELLSTCVALGIPGAAIQGAKLLARLRLARGSMQALDTLENLADHESHIRSVISRAAGTLRSRVVAAVSPKAENQAAALLDALRDVPGAWHGAVFQQAIGLDDDARAQLCAALDEEILTSEVYVSAVADAVQRFGDQVSEVGPNRQGGQHAAYLFHDGEMRMALVGFDAMRRERLYAHEEQAAGSDYFTFIRWIDGDMQPAAMARQLGNTAPPVIHVDDPDAKITNPHAPEIDAWRKSKGAKP